MKDFYKIVSVILFISMIYCSEPFGKQKKDKIYNITNNSSVINLDGLMTEDTWKDIDAINDYVQYSPFNMSAPTFKTETRMFYSDEGIYIFSRMYDDNPEKIQQRLANRDDYQNGFVESSDWIYFAFDR